MTSNRQGKVMNKAKRRITQTDVFDFFWTATEAEISDLGYRLAEKRDTTNVWEDVFAPLISGAKKGTIYECPFVRDMSIEDSSDPF